jgi:hypothetical protein
MPSTALVLLEYTTRRRSRMKSMACIIGATCLTFEVSKALLLCTVDIRSLADSRPTSTSQGIRRTLLRLHPRIRRSHPPSPQTNPLRLQRLPRRRHPLGLFLQRSIRLRSQRLGYGQSSGARLLASFVVRVEPLGGGSSHWIRWVDLSIPSDYGGEYRRFLKLGVSLLLMRSFTSPAFSR